MKKIGIYIHIPFCASKCKYCNFNSFSGKNALQKDYLGALVDEIKGYSNKSYLIDSIFIGGGTPSMMYDGCISTILSSIKKSFRVAGDVEITIEANPNSITLNNAREWKEAGVNRVSIGLQSASNTCLKMLGRVHTKDDYIKAVDTIKSVGITNINTDCLIGIPRQRLSDVKYMLRLVNKVGCTHVSVYSLILERDTELNSMVERGEVKLPKEAKTLGMYDFALKYLREQGFERYEVSNFCKPDYECKHNLHTWKMHEYLGFGAGAHSYLMGERYCNVSSIEEYIDITKSGKKPIEFKEVLSRREILEEIIMLGLRTKKGINHFEIEEEIGVDLLKVKKKELKFLADNGFIEVDGNWIRATDLGFTVLNRVILELV